MAKHRDGKCALDCWMPLGLPTGAKDGQALVYDSTSQLQLRWGDPLKGDKGDPGAPGVPGERGLTGSPGINGLPGAPGRDGVQGLKGEPGAPGRDGRDGRDGANGYNGITPHIEPDGYWYIGSANTGYRAIGQDGKDGKDGRIGPQGAPGAPGKQGIQGPPGPASSVMDALLLTIANLEQRVAALEADSDAHAG